MTRPGRLLLSSDTSSSTRLRVRDLVVPPPVWLIISAEGSGGPGCSALTASPGPGPPLASPLHRPWFFTGSAATLSRRWFRAFLRSAHAYNRAEALAGIAESRTRGLWSWSDDLLRYHDV